jgi:hypothetical protein
LDWPAIVHRFERIKEICPEMAVKSRKIAYIFILYAFSRTEIAE